MSATVTFSVDTPQGTKDVQLVHRRAGSGDPVLLLHGIGHHLQAWDPVFGILAAEREVIAVDLPGFGASAALPDGIPYDLSGVVPVLGALCAALDLERPHVVGNSLGGLLALEMGRQKLVRSVTALSPAGFWTQPERRYAFGTLLAMYRGASLLPLPMIEGLSRSAAGRAALTSTIYARPGRRSPEAVVAETLALREAAGFHQTLAAGRSVDLRRTFDLDTDAVPVTVGWGSRDRLLLRRQGVRAKQTLPGARLIRLPGCGHVPMNDDPALVARVIEDTCRRAKAV